MYPEFSDRFWGTLEITFNLRDVRGGPGGDGDAKWEVLRNGRSKGMGRS